MKLFKKLKSKYIELRPEAGGRIPNPESRIPHPASRIAVSGDVHANLEALKTVLADAAARGISQFICTGDVVGYGANPSECLKLIRDLNCPVVLGNHDSYAATDDSLKDFNLNAMNAILWTRERLSAEERAWLGGLPMEMDVGGQRTEVRSQQSGIPDPASRISYLVHSTMIEPAEWHYILKPEKAEAALRAQEPDIVFFGHTHVPSIFSYNPETDEFRSEFPAAEGIHQLELGWKHLINPGSVGQPRDRDPRASYALYDPEAGTIEIRRIEYDIAATKAKIEAAGLPLRNAERLSKGR